MSSSFYSLVGEKQQILERIINDSLHYDLRPRVAIHSDSEYRSWQNCTVPELQVELWLWSKYYCKISSFCRREHSADQQCRRSAEFHGETLSTANRIYSVVTQVWSVVVLIGCGLGSIMAAATTSCKTMTPWRQCQPSVTPSGTGSYLSTWLSISLPVLPACTRHFINSSSSNNTRHSRVVEQD